MTPIVFLPGSLCDRRLFEHQLIHFGAQATCIEFDFCDSVEEAAAHVLDAMPSRAVLVGLSLGGIVAAEIASKAPERIAGLVLLDTNVAAAHPEQVEQRRRWEQMTRSGQFADVVRELVPVLTNDVVGNGPVVSAMALDAGAEVFLRQNRAIIDRRDRFDDLASLTCPVLVGCGADDLLCPPAIHTLIADTIPSATLVVVADSGHLSTLDQPATVTEALEEWLETTTNHPRRGNL